jgi:CheY-like chemotaxis protein
MTCSTTTKQHPCVLVVDDEEDIRDTLREVVEMAGCTALVAANGAEALQVLAQHRPCLIILDLLMPIMTGAELLEAMQKAPELADLKVLISTSAPSRAPAGWPVLAKPISIHKLWDSMRTMCDCATSIPTRR